MKRIRLLDISLSALIVLLIAFTLAPAVARLQRSPGDAKCQSNLRQWAKTMELYLSDNDQAYPTNRDYNVLSFIVKLTRETTPPQVMPDGTPRRFEYGVNWVEALYPYIKTSAARTGQDWKSFRKCPNAPNQTDITGGLTATSCARMNYAFNRNLVEYHSSLLRNPASLMMLRETDRRVNSILRPLNLSTATVTPIAPFLSSKDSGYTTAKDYSPVQLNQHGNGSYIVFADGHVRYFTTDYYPDTPTWDPVTGQWYNFVYANPANDIERAHNKTIAITP